MENLKLKKHIAMSEGASRVLKEDGSEGLTSRRRAEAKIR